MYDGGRWVTRYFTGESPSSSSWPPPRRLGGKGAHPSDATTKYACGVWSRKPREVGLRRAAPSSRTETPGRLACFARACPKKANRQPHRGGVNVSSGRSRHGRREGVRLATPARLLPLSGGSLPLEPATKLGTSALCVQRSLSRAGPKRERRASGRGCDRGSPRLDRTPSPG